MVMETDILFKGIPANNTFMFSSEQIDTPALPTSPTLQNDMQVRVVNLLIVNPKIPYTDNGIGLVENQMLASLKDGQKYGGIAPTEYDADGNAIPGYTTSVPLAADLTSAQKASRILKDCKFSARIAGAIHVVEIKGCLTYEKL